MGVIMASNTGSTNTIKINLITILLFITIITLICVSDNFNEFRQFHTKDLETLKQEKEKCESNIPRNQSCNLTYSWIIKNNDLNK
jgi:hypothetical protein